MLGVQVSAEWVIVALTVAGLIAAFTRSQSRVYFRIRNLRSNDRALLQRIEDLEKAYELIGMTEDERLKKHAYPRRFVPRVRLILDDDDDRDKYDR